MKKILTSLILIGVCGICLYFILIPNTNSIAQESCRNLKLIANDSDKIIHLEHWIENKISDKQFLKSMGWLGVIRGVDSPDEINNLGLDWNYIGIDSSSAMVRLNRNYEDHDNFMDSSTIKSVSFGEGRDSLSIKISQDGEWGIDRLDKIAEKIEFIGDKIALFCY